jgi:hypothetical protein
MSEHIQTVGSSTPAAPAAETRANRRRQHKFKEAFWRVATLFSFIVNLILIIVLLNLGIMVFQIKDAIAQPLIGGLHTSFVDMDRAHIKTTIWVSDTILVQDTMPVVFDLPLSTNTVVVLTEDTPIPNTMVSINTGIINLNAPATVTLPKGTPLNINLNLIVPVSQTIPVVLKVPVALEVPVDIPLDQTELHPPFTRLASLVGPYDQLISKLPSSWREFFGIK